ncbi:MAG: hypothetical protein ACK42D_02195 [Candidatus Paceibacteria bacterium]
MMLAQASQVLYKALALTAGLLLLFVLFEPVVTRSAPASATDDFTIHQEILAEISLTLGTTTVQMTGPIGGVTGGTATGTNYAVVRANSGYTITLEFENNPAMLGDNTGSTGILNYSPVGAQPDYDFVPSTSAVFAYTVSSEPLADLAPAFKDGVSSCGTGGTDYTPNRCWQGPSTSPYTVIDRSTNTGTGSATTTFTFVVNVPNNPVPFVPADFYTATATLTATVQ